MTSEVRCWCQGMCWWRCSQTTTSACGEDIVLMDFDSFQCQDIVHGFHWDRSQVNLHPAVVYYGDDRTSDWSLRFNSVINPRTHGKNC